MLRMLPKAPFELVSGIVALATAIMVGMLILASRLVMYSELEWHFERSALLEGNLNQVLLTSKYETQRKLYQEQTTQQAVDENEFLLGLVLDKEMPRPMVYQLIGPLEKLSAKTINILRRFTGKGSLPTAEEQAQTHLLYKAFRLEHERQYALALSVYEGLLQRTTDPILQGVIQLHQGFCAALLGQKSRGRQHYQNVIRNHPQDDLGVVAAQLLKHLDAFEEDQLKLAQSSLPALPKARKLVQLLDCAEAVRILDTLQTTADESAEKLLLQARCAEENGKKGEAAKAYLEAIATAGQTDIARDANRRLYLLSSTIPDSSAMRATAIQINETLQDSLITSFQSLKSDTLALLSTKRTAIPDTVPQTLDDTAALVPIPPPPVDVSPVQTKKAPAMAPPAIPAHKISQGERAVIRMRGGKEFSGMVLSGPNEPVIRLKTLIGVIGIPRDQIDTSLAP